MGLFRKKGEVVDAAVYKPGMEDGFGYQTPDGVAYVWDGLGRLVGPPADRQKVPVVLTPNGYMPVGPGDYVVTDITGSRRPYRPDIFNARFEPDRASNTDAIK